MTKRLIMNVEDVTSINGAAPQLLQFNRSSSTGYYNRLIVSGVEYGPNEAYTAGYLETTRELKNPLPAGATLYKQLVCTGFNHPDQTYGINFAGLAMKCTWSGGASITSIDSAGDAGTLTVNLAARTCTFTMTATSAGAPQGGYASGTASLWFNLNTDVSTEPPTNIKIYPAAYESLVLAGNIFHPTWISEVQNYKILRLMDAMQTNNNIAVNFSDFATDSYIYYSDNTTTYGRKICPPPSFVAALAAESGVDVWVCLPHMLTDAAVTSYAEYLRDNISASRMIYVEFSNEVWNPSFNQDQDCRDKAAIAAIPAWSADNAYTQGQKWAGMRSAQYMEIFRTVFGSDSGTRWTGVLSIWTAVLANYDAVKAGVDYHIANDAGAASTITKLYSHLALAPYYGMTPTTTASGIGATVLGWVNESLSRDDNYAYFSQQMYDNIKFDAVSSNTYVSIKFWQEKWQYHIANATSLGLTVIWYEGGYGALCAQPLRDNLSGETEGDKLTLAFVNFAESEYVGFLNMSIWNAFVADGGAIPAHYSHFGIRNKYGSWASKQYLTDPCAKGRSCVDWSNGIQRFRLGA